MAAGAARALSDRGGGLRSSVLLPPMRFAHSLQHFAFEHAVPLPYYCWVTQRHQLAQSHR